MKMLVLGAGKMTEAILMGLKSKMDLGDVHIFSPSGVSAAKLAEKVGAQHLASVDKFTNPDYVLIGCKPQQLVELNKIIGNQFNHSLFISMLAALPEADQCSVLGAKKLVRIMPNLPVGLGEGVTLISSQSAPESLQKVQALFNLLGEAPIVSEAELEDLTILTGSGPALFYEFARNLASCFSSLNEKQREILVRKVLSGAALTTTSTPQILLSEHISAVTSKGGVTIAVLEEWRKEGMSELLKKGVDAGKIRSQELKKLIPQS